MDVSLVTRVSSHQVSPCPSAVILQPCGPRQKLVVTLRYTSAYVRHTLGDSVTAEDEKVRLDENDAVSVKVWATWLQ